MAKKEIILGVTGSIASYKACDIIQALKKEKFVITVVMTKEAQEFITPLSLSSLSGNKLYSQMFAEPDGWDIEHISLTKKADLVLIAPATANIIGKIASGICDDLLTCVVCASKVPVLICPAMNENMYKNRIVQDNIKKLKSFGYKFVEPREGMLACGEMGLGCLAEVETIIKEIKKVL